MTNQIKEFCKNNHIHFVGQISYDTIVTDAMVQAKTIIEFSNGAISEEINRMWDRIVRSLTNQSH